MSGRYWFGLLSAVLISASSQVPLVQNAVSASAAASLHEAPPDWAFVINPPSGASATPAGKIDTAPQHVRNSTAAFTLAQIADLFTPPDWHPDEHPAMPSIVSRGRPPEVFACGYCHLPNGEGRPENSSLAGLPAAYIVQQVDDFKNGRRKSSDPRHAPTSNMIMHETKATPQETRSAAEYFSALKPKPWIRVVETDTVPKTHVAGWMFVASENGGTEPIGQRIIETPENLERTELRDDQSGFIAYVPPGSIKKGEMLASGVSKALRCATCHGRDLKGHGNVPRIAARSPSYLVRQLYDIQHGSRSGAASNRMRPVVAKLSIDDMVALAAYVASLNP